MIQIVITFEHSGKRYQVALVDDTWAGEENVLSQLLRTLNRDYLPEYLPEEGSAWLFAANRVLEYLGTIGATSVTIKEMHKDAFFRTPDPKSGRLPIT